MTFEPEFRTVVEEVGVPDVDPAPMVWEPPQVRLLPVGRVSAVAEAIPLAPNLWGAMSPADDTSFPGDTASEAGDGRRRCRNRGGETAETTCTQKTRTCKPRASSFIRTQLRAGGGQRRILLLAIGETERP